MERLSKKYKIYLSCLGILLIVGIGFALYCSNQERKIQEQKQKIEKYVSSMIESENNINTKLNLIRNGSMTTLGDYSYIEEQIKNLGNCDNCLYSLQTERNEYLDEYTKSQTNYDTYEQYYDHLCKKYNLNNKDDGIEYEEWYNQCAQKLIDSVESK